MTTAWSTIRSIAMTISGWVPGIGEVKTNIYQGTQQSALKTREKPTPQQLQQQQQQQPHSARAQ